MRGKCVQMSLFDICKNVENALEVDKPLLFRLSAGAILAAGIPLVYLILL